MEDGTGKTGSSDEYRLLAEMQTDMIVKFDGESRLLFANPSYCKTFGKTQEELLGKRFMPLIHEDDREKVREVLDNLGKPPYSGYVEERALTRNGWRWQAWNNAVILDKNNEIEAIVAIGRDITDRKEAERAIEESAFVNKHLHSLLVSLNRCRTLDQMLDAVLEAAVEVCHMDGGAVYVIEANNAVIRRHKGFSGEFIREVECMPLSMPVIKKAIEANKPVNIGDELEELRDMMRSHGIQNSYTVALRAGEKVVGFLNLATSSSRKPDPGLTRIISNIALEAELFFQKLLAEEALRKSEERFRTLVEGTSDWIWEIDENGVYTYASPKIRDLLGYEPEEVTGKMTPYDLMPADEAERVKGLFDDIFRSREPFTGLVNINRHRDGRRVVLETGGVPVFDESGKFLGYRGIDWDITDRIRAEEGRRLLEEQVRHAQKLESLGLMAGGIAHDFNNMLTAILGNADMALLELSPASPGRDSIAEIIKVAHCAADLCKQMLAYSGKGQFVIEVFDLSEAVREISHMLEVSISKKVTLNYHLSDNLPAVEADVTQIHQVIMNLIANASDAIGKSAGIISITTGEMHCDRSYLSETYIDEELPEGAYVYIEVTDSGCGMDEETMAKLFDPFFSTKFTGRGLGMAAVLGILRSHRGAIKIYSEPGRGSTFKVLFPSSEKPVTHAEPSREKSSGWRGSGKILLVDDEESILAVGRRMLERVGFEVVTARDGEQALEAFRDSPDEIDCVFLDLTMPNVDGETCFREMRKLRPDVCVIMSSGYNEQEVTQRFIGKGLAAFIQKPYRFDEMIETLREVLGD